MLHVPPPGGHGHGVPIEGEAQLLQHLPHILRARLDAQETVDLLRLQPEPAGRAVPGHHVDDPVHHVARVQQLHQLAGPFHRGKGAQGIQPLFEAGGCVRAHAQGDGGAPDGGAVEVGGLEDHRGGILGDLAVLPAHDTGQTDGLALVRDHQHIRRQGSGAAVQGGHLLPLVCPAHQDMAAGDAAVVEGMHGLTVFHHHVVRDVNDVVDGADAAGPQSAPHPFGGGRDAHVFHEAGGVTGAQIRLQDIHVQVVQDAVPAALHLRLRQLQGGIEGGGGFPGQAPDAQAVRPVIGDLKVHHAVPQADHLPDILAHGAGLLKDENAVRDGVGIVVHRQAQLPQGAEHALRRHAPEDALFDALVPGQGGTVQGGGDQIPLMHVLGAGDDLHGLIPSHLHLADPEMVAVGMADDLRHPAHHHIGDVLSQYVQGLHLGAGHGHAVAEFLIGNTHPGEFIQPIS